MLRLPNPQNAIDKQVAAIVLLHDLTVVTSNTDDFAGCGVGLSNRFKPGVAEARSHLQIVAAAVAGLDAGAGL